MSRWTRRFRGPVVGLGLALVAASCGSAAQTVQVGAAAPEDEPPATEVPEPGPGEPATSTARGIREETRFSDDPFDQLVEAATPLPPDGGRLQACDEIAELEASTEGNLGGRQNVDPIVMGVLLTYRLEHADSFGGLWLDRNHGGTIVLAFTDDSDQHREAILERGPSPDDEPAQLPPPPITDARPLGERDDVTIDVVRVTHTEVELMATLNELSSLFSGDFGLVAMSLGTLRNRVELELIDATDEGLRALAELIPTGAVCVNVSFTPEPPSGELDVIPDPESDLMVTCGGSTSFPYSTLLDPPTIDEVDHPAVEALRLELDTPSGEPLPRDGWAVLAVDDEMVLFATFGEETFYMVSFTPGSNRWVLSGLSAGSDCDPVVALPDGLGRVGLRLDPNRPLSDSQSTTVHLLATELDCASGEAMGDRLLGPQVVETEHTVLIAMAAVPVFGAADCQDNPSTPVTIELSAPLGDRVVADGLTVPPKPLTTEAD